ncbi:type II secretion system protein N [Acinetobacter baylyi]|uniref:type II secretion system protein N n=1 Tax=Acinetobacter baylyi TaxID=202950 RepID=UPI0031E05BF3
MFKSLMQYVQDKPWQHLDRLASVTLAVLILWLCWKLAALFWLLLAPPQVMQFERVQLGSQQAQIPNISSFALFNEPNVTNNANDQQNFELQGVMLAYPARFSSAVIKGKENADRYRIGDAVDNSSYQLAEVYWDHVVLRQSNGATREIRFKGMEKGLYQPIVPPASATTSTTNDEHPSSPPSAGSAIGQAIQQMQQNRDQYLQNMGVSNSGEGYEVTDRTPSALKNTLGLRAGDRILSVNGQRVGQGQNDVQLLEQARRDGQVKIEIKRGDQVMTIQQSFK